VKRLSEITEIPELFMTALEKNQYGILLLSSRDPMPHLSG
jgi:hypothetical protein